MEEITDKTQIVLKDLGSLKADGNLWLTLPDGVEKIITPTVAGNDFYTFNVSGQKTAISLRSVSFGGLGILQDDGSGVYTAPQWENDAQGNVLYHNPVLLVAGNQVQTEVEFAASGDGTFSLIIKGEVSGGHSSFTLWATNHAPSGTNWSVTAYADQPLAANTVDCFNPMTIKWSYAASQTSQPLQFLDAGASTNLVYVTWKMPTTAALYHTVVDVACRNAAGKSTEADIVAGVWSVFTSRSIMKADGTGPLTYYANNTQPYNTPQNGLSDLMRYSDARCGAFQQFFQATLATHGIASTWRDILPSTFYIPVARSDYYTLYGHAPENDGYLNDSDHTRDVFFVKNWNLDSLNTNRWGAVDLSGAPAQGNANPIAVFHDHVLVLYGGKVYDPSYGTGAFTSLIEWQDHSVDGFGVQFRKYPDDYSADFKFWIGNKETNGVLQVTY